MPQDTASFIVYENIGATLNRSRDNQSIAYENVGLTSSHSRQAYFVQTENIGATLTIQTEPVIAYEYIVAAKMFIGWGIPIDN